MQNRLFIRINRILTLCWGALYLAVPLWTYLLPRASWVVPLNLALPILLGIFTGRFPKWYAARFASG